MRIKNILTMFSCIILFATIGHAQEKILYTEIRIDAANADRVTASHIFDKINFIPLETTKESIFGRISQLFVTDKYFIIRDPDTRCILVFYKNGKFHCKIVLDGKSSGEINVDKERSQIICTKGNQLLHYNFDGKIVKQEKTVFNSTNYYLSNNHMVCAQYMAWENYYPDSTDYELRVTNNNKVVAKYLKYNMKTAIIQSNDRLYDHTGRFRDSGNDTAAYYCRPYDYNIYEITPKSISAFSFVFPLANTLPETFYTDINLKGKRLDYISSHPERIFGVSDPFKLGNNLFFRISRWNAPLDSYLYHLKSGSLFSIKYIEPDALSDYLPLTDLNEGIEFANANFLASDGLNIYSAMSSSAMFKFKDSNAEKNVHYRPALADYFKNRSRTDNPVIIQLQPKVIPEN